jgi:hypothetical protein
MVILDRIRLTGLLREKAPETGLFLCPCVALAYSEQTTPEGSAGGRAAPAVSYASLPLTFVAN